MLLKFAIADLLIYDYFRLYNVKSKKLGGVNDGANLEPTGFGIC